MAGRIRVRESKRGRVEVRQTLKYEYEARSQDKEEGGWYRIAFVLGKWCCECKSFAQTGRACKHVAAMRRLFAPERPPARPRPRRRQGRSPLIRMPPIKCRHCRSAEYKNAYVRHNKYYDVQVYRCLGRCGRIFTHDDGYLFRTYRRAEIVTALEDRSGGKTPHNIHGSLLKTRPGIARSTPYTWYTAYPRMAAPFLMSLPYRLSPVMLVDEKYVNINGVRHVFFTTLDEGTRIWPATQVGRFKGSHSVKRLFKMDMEIRGFAPELVKSDGAANFASAHKAAMLRNAGGTTSFHARHIHMTGDTNTNMKERHNDTLGGFMDTCRGFKSTSTTLVSMFAIHYNFARIHTTIGKTPAEAAGIRFEDPDKWAAIIACSADFNCDVEARRRKKRSRKDSLPEQPAFQVKSLFHY